VFLPERRQVTGHRQANSDAAQAAHAPDADHRRRQTLIGPTPSHTTAFPAVDNSADAAPRRCISGCRRQQAALPPYLRKSSAFPKGPLNTWRLCRRTPQRLCRSICGKAPLFRKNRSTLGGYAAAAPPAALPLYLRKSSAFPKGPLNTWRLCRRTPFDLKVIGYERFGFERLRVPLAGARVEIFVRM
jgi:hypothetical protein